MNNIVNLKKEEKRRVFNITDKEFDQLMEYENYVSYDFIEKDEKGYIYEVEFYNALRYYRVINNKAIQEIKSVA